MQKITLLTVGKPKELWVREACALYMERLRPQVALSVLELSPSRGKTGPAQRAEESDRLLKSLEGMQGDIWVLDETGKVISAQVTDGPQILREAAVQAALKATFSPTKLSGQPVKVTGIINYKFALSQ